METVSVCAGCGEPGFGPGVQSGQGRALHWMRKGRWVCIDCSKTMPPDEGVPPAVVEALLDLEHTVRSMRGAVAPFTRRVDDNLRRLDELRGKVREVPRVVIQERESAVAHLRTTAQTMIDNSDPTEAPDVLRIVARELEVGTHVHGCKP